MTTPREIDGLCVNPASNAKGVIDMAMVMKGRTSIKRNAPEMTGTPLTLRKPRGRTIQPWLFDDEVKRSATFAKLESSYLAVLASVDGTEDRKAEAAKSGRYTPEGLLADTLQFAASNVAPELRKAQRLVEAAKGEVAAKRAKLTLPIDRSRRLRTGASCRIARVSSLTAGRGTSSHRRRSCQR